jgi:hypothetical protein
LQAWLNATFSFLEIFFELLAALRADVEGKLLLALPSSWLFSISRKSERST